MTILKSLFAAVIVSGGMWLAGPSPAAAQGPITSGTYAQYYGHYGGWGGYRRPYYGGYYGRPYAYGPRYGYGYYGNRYGRPYYRRRSNGGAIAAGIIGGLALGAIAAQAAPAYRRSYRSSCYRQRKPVVVNGRWTRRLVTVCRR